MRSRWVLIGLLIAASAAVAIWGLWTAPPEVAEDAGSAHITRAPADPEPARPFSWRFASSRPRRDEEPDAPVAPANPQSPDLDPGGEPCGEGGPCPAGSACVDGGCLTTACGSDSGASRCVLANTRPGTCCGERCADLQGDVANCGRCGASCLAGQTCTAGRCLAQSCKGQMAGAVCANRSADGACCRGGCVDPSAWASDPANCGGCGHACAPGLACRQGICVDPLTGNRPAWTCVDEAHSCPEGSFCVIDACFPKACSGDSDGLICPVASGQLGHCCGKSCTDLFEDPLNCRACGVHCAEHQICRDGECVTPR